ncbi:MAG: hypothetical protein AB8B87_10730 [Granulosicoccus sp.]
MNKHLRVLLLPLIITIGACSDSSTDSASGFVRTADTVELAVIGDSPYQPEEVVEFPGLVASINADAFVSKTIHVGDIKAGATQCTDQRLQETHNLFQTFDEPLLYTIGDNEWTDCIRQSAGGYDPEERLAKLREIFFSMPGTSLGRSTMQVEAQSGYPENQLWQEKGIVFGTMHIVGTNNNLRTGPGIATAEQQSEAGSTEYGRRTAANLAWMRNIFTRAQESQAAGVALFFHADMWKSQEVFDESTYGGFRQIVQELSIQAEAFGKPVLMVSGENHRYRVDPGVSWFSLYDVSPVSNLTQVVVQRGVEFFNNNTQVRYNWLRVQADASKEEVFNVTVVVAN